MMWVPASSPRRGSPFRAIVNLCGVASLICQVVHPTVRRIVPPCLASILTSDCARPQTGLATLLTEWELPTGKRQKKRPGGKVPGLFVGNMFGRQEAIYAFLVKATSTGVYALLARAASH